MQRVVAGLLCDSAGRVLWAQRPAHKADAGLWELPGGKCESGESAEQALRRELREELGIEVEHLERWPEGDHIDPERGLELCVYRVARWQGEPRPLEHQALAWRQARRAHRWPSAPLDVTAVRALSLGRCYAISPPDPDPARLLAAARRALERGARLLSLRLPDATPPILARGLEALRALLDGLDVELLVHREVALVERFDLGGVQLSSAQLWQLERRPLPATRWVGASCHTLPELERAARLGLDFVTLSPVQPTRSHPAHRALGWPGFAALARRCPLPCYALGGLGPGELARAREHGAWGVAAITGFCG